LLDLEMYSGRIVVAAPKQFEWNKVNGNTVRIASEFEFLSKQFFKRKKINFKFIRSFGATEAFPPNDSDIIVDNVFSGNTLKKNGLKEYETVLKTSARLIANKKSFQNEEKIKQILEIADKIQQIIKGGFNENNY
jgi:ATP phosphoribosyltransferase